MVMRSALQLLGALSVVVLFALGSASLTGASQDGISTIAGSQPDRRPDTAPTITKFDKTDAWYGQALRGIEQPYPYSLRFLEDQGAWYTPFNHNGMPGRYDIRGLHGR